MLLAICASAQVEQQLRAVVVVNSSIHISGGNYSIVVNSFQDATLSYAPTDIQVGDWLWTLSSIGGQTCNRYQINTVTNSGIGEYTLDVTSPDLSGTDGLPQVGVGNPIFRHSPNQDYPMFISSQPTLSGYVNPDIQTCVTTHLVLRIDQDISAISGGAADGVVTGGAYDALNDQIDFDVNAPGIDFSVSTQGIDKTPWKDAGGNNTNDATIYVQRAGDVSIGVNDNTHTLRMDGDFQFRFPNSTGVLDWRQSGSSNWDKTGLLLQDNGEINNFSFTGRNVFGLAANNVSIFDRTILGSILWAGTDPVGGGLSTTAGIIAQADGSWSSGDLATDLNFFVTKNEESLPTNTFTLQSDGRVELDAYINFNDGVPNVLLGFEDIAKDITKHPIGGTPTPGDIIAVNGNATGIEYISPSSSTVWTNLDGTTASESSTDIKYDGGQIGIGFEDNETLPSNTSFSIEGNASIQREDGAGFTSLTGYRDNGTTPVWQIHDKNFAMNLSLTDGGENLVITNNGVIVGGNVPRGRLSSQHGSQWQLALQDDANKATMLRHEDDGLTRIVFTDDGGSTTKDLFWRGNGNDISTTNSLTGVVGHINSIIKLTDNIDDDTKVSYTISIDSYKHTASIFFICDSSSENDGGDGCAVETANAVLINGSSNFVLPELGRIYELRYSEDLGEWFIMNL